MLQQGLVLLIVAAAAAYAAWALMPVAWRRALARRLGWKAPPAAGCGGCDGCAAPPPGASPAERTIQVVRRPAVGPTSHDKPAAR